MKGERVARLFFRRREVSMKPPQYNGGLLGLQKREYLAKSETQFSKEFIVDMIIL